MFPSRIDGRVCGVLLLALTLVAPTAHAAERRNGSTVQIQEQSASRFLDNQNGTVSDPTQGLMWKKCSEGQTWRKAGNGCEGNAAGSSWDDALNQVEILNAGKGFAGYKDWRVPTVKELATLVEYDRPSPIDLTVFPATPSLWYWSSTPFLRQATRAWFVAFGSGDISIERIDNQSLHVRLVRNAR